MLEKSIGPLTKEMPNHGGIFSMGIINKQTNNNKTYLRKYFN
jgi:hypothetical protein